MAAPKPVKKKITIKPLKEPPKLPADFEETNWNTVSAALESIFDIVHGLCCTSATHTPSTQPPSNVDPDAAATSSISVLPRGVIENEAFLTIVKFAAPKFASQHIFNCGELLHSHGFSANSTVKLRELLQRRITAVTGAVIAEYNLTPTNALTGVSRLWEVVSGALTFIRLLLGFIDQSYISQHTPERSVRAMGIGILGRRLQQPAEGGNQSSSSPSSTILDHCREGFVQRLHEERSGTEIVRRELYSATRLFLSLQLYYDGLETDIIAATSKHFETEGESLVEVRRADAVEFVQTVEKHLQEEESRVIHCMDPSSRGRIEEVTQEQLITKHFATVCKRGLKPLLQSGDNATLKALFRLSQLRYVRQLDILRKSFREYVVEQGQQIMSSITDMEEEVIPMLLQLKAMCDKVVQQSWENNSLFALALREAYELFLRAKQNKAAQLLAKHFDQLLKDGGNRTDDEIETECDAALKLFSLIPSKDIFEAFYAKYFAKRLLLQRSANMEIERTVIERLKLICGASLGVKLHGMIKDIEYSKELQALIRQSPGVMAFAALHHSSEAGGGGAALETRESTLGVDEVPTEDSAALETRQQSGTMDRLPSAMQLTESGGFARQDTVEGGGEGQTAAPPGAWIGGFGFDFNVSILKQGIWPSYPDLTPILPTALTQQMKIFERYYCSKHSSRRLTWQHVLSHAVVRGRFRNGKKKEFVVSFIQALILMLYNDHDVLSFAEIQEKLSIPAESNELVCALISLSAGNAKVLKRDKAAAKPAPSKPRPKHLAANQRNPAEVIADHDKFTYQADFTHRLTKIRVNQVQLKETKEEEKETTDKVFADRQYVVDAAIVRFMKSRKRAHHNELMAEVAKIVRFPVQPPDVKKRIEVLIERDYLERDEREQGFYNYLAV